MSTIQLLEAKFDGLENRVIRIEKDVAELKVIASSTAKLLQTLAEQSQERHDVAMATLASSEAIIGNLVTLGEALARDMSQVKNCLGIEQPPKPGQ